MRAFLMAILIAAPVWGGELSVTGAINAALRQNIVIVGEVHDNPTHHFVQREFARAIRPSAVVFEMIEPRQETVLNRLLKDGASDDQIAKELNWADAGWPDIAQYTQIMRAADAPVYGAAVPRGQARAAVLEGGASVLGEQAAKQFGIDQPLPAEEQAEREAHQHDAHCGALPAEMLPGMVEVQRLRDAALALASMRAHRDTKGPVLVITGNGHADLLKGAPAALSRAAPSLTVFSFGQLEAVPDGPVPFDGYHITLPVERDDPCAAFSKS